MSRDDSQNVRKLINLLLSTFLIPLISSVLGLYFRSHFFNSLLLFCLRLFVGRRINNLFWLDFVLFADHFIKVTFTTFKITVKFFHSCALFIRSVFFVYFTCPTFIIIYGYICFIVFFFFFFSWVQECIFLALFCVTCFFLFI
eukprot:UN09796